MRVQDPTFRHHGLTPSARKFTRYGSLESQASKPVAPGSLKRKREGTEASRGLSSFPLGSLKGGGRAPPRGLLFVSLLEIDGTGLDWFRQSLHWFRLVWIGLDWLGLV